VGQDAIATLHRVLRTRDLVLLNIAAIVGLRWLSTAAKIGPASLSLWVLGLLAFFIPSALAVLELSSRIPGEGGFYLWTKSAFGDLHGFIAGWSYWVSNLVFFPSTLLFGAGVSVYIAGGPWIGLAESAGYNAVFCLVSLWAITALNIVGLGRAKWLQNIGGIATWLVAALILAGGAVAWHRFGPATAFTPASLQPDLGSLAALTTFATIAFAYSGLELGPLMGGEIQDPRKQLPRAILISGVVIAAVYMAGTASLLIALPAQQIDLIGGIPQALAAVGDRLGVALFGPLTAALIVISNIGGISAWMNGTARLPFVVGVDRYLPKALGALHPRHGSPHVALLTQSAITTLVLLAAISGSTVHDAFVVLVDMTLILGFLPLLYIFASLPVLRRRGDAKSAAVTQVPGGRFGCWVVSGCGFATTLLAIVTSMVPPEGAGIGVFLAKVLGGSSLLILVGLGFYRSGHRRAKALGAINAEAKLP